MSFTKVDTQTNHSTPGTTVAVTFGAPTIGNLLVVCYRASTVEANVTVPTPAGGGSWTKRTSDSYPSAANHEAIYTHAVGAGDSATITFTTSTSVNQSLIGYEVASSNGTPLFDQAAVISEESSVTSIRTSNLVTTDAVTFLVAMVATQFSTGVGVTASDSFTVTIISGMNREAAATRSVVATGTYATTFDWATGTPREASALLISLKEPVASVTGFTGWGTAV